MVYLNFRNCDQGMPFKKINLRVQDKAGKKCRGFLCYYCQRNTA